MERTWIFQANPKVFDIDGYLASCAGDFRFLVSRYKNEIKIGDTVYIWKSQGKEKDPEASGVIASSKVVGEVESGVADVESLPFWKDVADADATADRVLLRLSRLANKKQILKRDWLKDDSVLKDLAILKFASGTNFPVNAKQAGRLARLWSNTGRDWTEPEIVAALQLYDRLWNKQVGRGVGSPIEQLSQKISRAPTGVYNKLMNFRALDPRVEAKGFSGGSKLDALVWSRYYDPETATLDQLRLSSDADEYWGENVADGDADLVEAGTIADEVRRLSDKPLSELLSTYAKAPRNRTKRSRASVSTFNRSPLVVAITVSRAQWRCEVEGCGSPILNGRDGKPLVEVHHLHRLADGGADDIYNTVCVCPNHHRALHHGILADQIRRQLVQRRLRDA